MAATKKRKTVVVSEGPREAKRVDVSYLAALEDLADAADTIVLIGLSSVNVARLEEALKRLDALEARQDFYRADHEIGKRSLRRFDGGPLRPKKGGGKR